MGVVVGMCCPQVDLGVDLTITAMLSFEGERVPLIKVVSTVLAEGKVEMWLQQLEQAMRFTLGSAMKRSLDDFSTSVRHEWVQRWPCMVVLTVNDMLWTQSVEAAILSQRGGAPDAAKTALGQLLATSHRDVGLCCSLLSFMRDAAATLTICTSVRARVCTVGGDSASDSRGCPSVGSHDVVVAHRA